MLKKIIFILLVSIASTYAIAQPVNNTIDLSKVNAEPTLMRFDMVSQEDVNVVGGGPASNFILYVNHHITPGMPSDPVRLICDGRLKIVNPGFSATCQLPLNRQATFAIEPGFYHYGASGYLIPFVD